MRPGGERLLLSLADRRNDRAMKRVSLVFGLMMLAASGSAEERAWRLGVLTPFDWPADISMHNVMLPELARRGFVEGRNLVVIPRWGSVSDLDKLTQLAQDLAAAKPDVIIAVSPFAISAAMKAAPQTPIVASFTTDPVIEGEAASLSRPGGKVTGVAMLSFDGDRKRFELLHEAIPTAHKFGYLTYRRLTLTYRRLTEKDNVRRAAIDLGVEIVSYKLHGSSEYLPAFDAMRDAHVDALVIGSSPVFHRDAAQLATFAQERRLPTICEWREMASSGCLVGYGPDLAELRLRTADFVARLFAGGNPAEMPFEQPTHFATAINNKVAHAIGITLPTEILIRADEVIE